MKQKPLIVELRDVHKRYETPGQPDRLEVLRGVDLEVRAGESVAVAGPSGCGKSTLLNVISSLDRPSAGTVRVAGQDLLTLSDRALARMRNRQIGFIFQLHHLLAQCTLLENVLLPTLVERGGRGPAALARAEHLLQRVGLGECLRHRPGELSGGQRQRAAVARALINRPTLLLADEPTGSLDRRAAREVVDLLVELNQEEETTLILVSHSEEIAGRMARLLQLRDGVLQVAEGFDDGAAPG